MSGSTDALPSVHVIDDLEHLKVLADPLRLRILESLCDEARTTKQVAKRLDEPPTRLYHHVDALERAGFIRLERTRPVRGTLEKYFRAVARTFRADPGLFDLDGGVAELAVGAEILDRAAAELRALRPAAPSQEADEEAPALLVAGLSLSQVGRRRLLELRRRLEELIAEVEGWADDEDPSAEADRASTDRDEHRLVLALYPARTTPDPPDPEVLE